jgi:choline-sulfatase
VKQEVGYPEPRETEALYNHLDLLPTILDLAGIDNPNSFAIGKSVVPVIRDPAAQVQDHLLFSFDDRFYLPNNYPGGHIRGLIDRDWTYAVYFGLDGGGLEYELYDRKTDPGQLNNLLYDPSAAEVKKGMVATTQAVDGPFCRSWQFAGLFHLAPGPMTSHHS